MATRTLTGKSSIALVALGAAAALVAVTVFSSADAIVIDKSSSWTTVGSAGEIDEASRPLVSYGAGVAELKAGETGTAVIRHNITYAPKLDLNGLGHIDVAFRDAGAGTRVQAQVKSISTTGAGAPVTVLTFDSNEQAASGDLQVATATEDCLEGEFDFDFQNFAYVLEVRLSRGSAAQDTPRLQAARVYESDSGCT